MNRKLPIFVLVIVLLLSMTASAAFAQDDDEDVLKIGLLTDFSSGLAVYGVELNNGFMLGLEYATDGTMEIGGRPVEVIVRDNASDPDTTLEQARELITEEGVEILVGTVSSGATLGLIQLADDFDVLLFTGPAAAPNITGEDFDDNMFRICRNTFQDFLTIAPLAEEIVGGTDFVQFAADYAFGTGSAAAAEFALGSQGINFVRDTILVPLDATDFTPYLQEVLETDADGLIVIWAGSTTINLLQQIGELGVTDEITVLQAFNSNDFMPFLVPENLIGSLGWIVYHYTLPDNEINDWMVERHMEDYDGDVPDLFTECSFATAQALVAGVEATDGDTLPEVLIPELEGLEFEGPKGTYTIRAEDHQALVPMYLVRLDNLDDEAFAYYELVAEAAAEDIAPPCLVEDRCEMMEDEE